MLLVVVFIQVKNAKSIQDVIGIIITVIAHPLLIVIPTQRNSPVIDYFLLANG